MRKKYAFITVSVLSIMLCSSAVSCGTASYKNTYNTVGSSQKSLSETSVYSSSESAVSANPAQDTGHTYSIPDVIYTYDEWKKAMTYATDNLEESITLKISNYSEEKYRLDSLHFSDISITAEGSMSKRYATITFTFDYKDNFKILRAYADSTLLSKLSQDSLDALNKAKAIAASVTDNTMTDYEKEKAIHDYFVSNYHYGNDKGTENDAYTICGLFKNNCGYCEAYAYAFKLVCDIAGIDCYIAKGYCGETPHAWNIVCLEGEYYHIDVTGDDPLPDEPGRILYNYFNLTDSEIASSHTYNRNLSGNIICGGTKYQYYRYNNLVVENTDELNTLIQSRIANGENKIEFYTKGFIINSAKEIEGMLDGRLVSKYSMSGTYGKEGAYTLNITRR